MRVIVTGQLAARRGHRRSAGSVSRGTWTGDRSVVTEDPVRVFVLWGLIKNLASRKRMGLQAEACGIVGVVGGGLSGGREGSLVNRSPAPRSSKTLTDYR